MVWKLLYWMRSPKEWGGWRKEGDRGTQDEARTPAPEERVQLSGGRSTQRPGRSHWALRRPHRVIGASGILKGETVPRATCTPPAATEVRFAVTG